MSLSDTQSSITKVYQSIKLPNSIEKLDHIKEPERTEKLYHIEKQEHIKHEAIMGMETVVWESVVGM